MRPYANMSLQTDSHRMMAVPYGCDPRLIPARPYGKRRQRLTHTLLIILGTPGENLYHDLIETTSQIVAGMKHVVPLFPKNLLSFVLRDTPFFREVVKMLNLRSNVVWYTPES